MEFIHRVYGFFLLLFPEKYREDFSEELQIVFELSVADAAKKGVWEVAIVVLREFLSLPKAALIQHLRERRKADMTQKLGTYFQFTHGSLQEFISALCPFLLLGIISPVSALLAKNALLAGAMVVNVVGVAIFCVLIILFLAGFFSGMPRWFLPYVGLLLSFLSAMGFSLLLQKWDVIPFPALYSRSWYMGQIAFQGSLWGGLTLSAILLVSLTTLLPFLRRFKTDWTQLAFLLYGASPFALAITFDDYVNDELSTLFAFLVLMAGIWFYLRINNPRIQFWVLFGAMAVSMLFTAIAKAVIYQYFWIGIRHFTWWTEMMSTVIMWGWLALTMLIPLVLSGRTPEVRSTSLAGAQK